MTYAVKVFTKHDNKFHSYLSVKGKSFWLTEATPKKHAKEFCEMNPCLVAILVDNDTDDPIN